MLQALYLSGYVKAVPVFSAGIPLKGGTFPVKNGLGAGLQSEAFPYKTSIR